MKPTTKGGRVKNKKETTKKIDCGCILDTVLLIEDKPDSLTWRIKEPCKEHKDHKGETVFLVEVTHET